MKRMNIILAILLGLGCHRCPGRFGGAGHQRRRVYSMDEVKVAYPDLTEEVFGTLDANGDGALDADELAAGVDAGLLNAG